MSHDPSDWWPLVWSPDPDLCASCKGRVEDDVDNGFVRCATCGVEASTAKITRHNRLTTKRQRRAELYVANAVALEQDIKAAKLEFATEQANKLYTRRPTPSQQEIEETATQTRAGMRVIEQDLRRLASNED